MLQATYTGFGVASNATYWSTARSGGADGLGVASNATYWSTARSGGANGLGIVSPYNPEINRTLAGGLGIVPNDFEMGRMYGWYTPVQHGWINGKNRWYPGGNLGASAQATLAANGLEPDETNMLLRELVKAERTKAVMSIVSGIAIAFTAYIAIVRVAATQGKEI